MDLHRYARDSAGYLRDLSGRREAALQRLAGGYYHGDRGPWRIWEEAQPLAVKLAGGVSMCVEIDSSRIQRTDRDALPG